MNRTAHSKGNRPGDDPLTDGDSPRRFRVLLETERDDPISPIFPVRPIGSTSWGEMPDALIDRDGRAVGVVTDIWRQRGTDRWGDLAYIWIKGTLNPGETMPYRYDRPPGLDPNPWLVPARLREVEQWMRTNADAMCNQAGSEWRHDLAMEMESDPVDVGVGPVVRRVDGADFRRYRFRVALLDVRSEDPRTSVKRWDPPGLPWVEGVIVPLDNPWATARTAVAAAQLERSRPVNRSPTSTADRGAELQRRLDSLGGNHPPDLAR